MVAVSLKKKKKKKNFFQAEDGIRDVERSRGLGDVYKRQDWGSQNSAVSFHFAVLQTSGISGAICGVQLDESMKQDLTFIHINKPPLKVSLFN